jgi:segregation and condensation protein B
VRRLSRAATEALAIIAYHEPVSRAEIEAIRGVQTAAARSTCLMEAGWVRVAGRREVPGARRSMPRHACVPHPFRPGQPRDLPGIGELRAGLLDPVDEAYAVLMGSDDRKPAKRTNRRRGLRKRQIGTGRWRSAEHALSGRQRRI